MVMSVEVIKPGLLTTLQDAGRTGYASVGIHPTGAMDREALFLANALVGNADNMAAIEIHFPAAVFRFHQDALIAITGADWEPRINDEPIAINQTTMIKAGSVFTCRQPNKGARSYLAIAGGFDIPIWLGSYSTDLSASALTTVRKALAVRPLRPITLPISSG
jgi:antagonist of KipI